MRADADLWPPDEAKPLPRIRTDFSHDWRADAYPEWTPPPTDWRNKLEVES